MSGSDAQRASGSARPGRRWLPLLGLLLAEYLAISLRFDALPLLGEAGVSAAGRLGAWAPLLLVVASATYLLAGRALRAELSRVLGAHGEVRHRRVFIGANLASYAALFLVTRTLVTGRADGGAWIWLAACGGCFVLTVASLVLAAIPLRAIIPLARRARELVLAGVGLGAFAWMAGLASAKLWAHLRELTLRSVYLLLYPFDSELTYLPDEAVIGTGDFFVVVSPECSGLEGIGLMVVFSALYLWTARARLRWPRALWLLPLGVVCVFLGNAARIALLIAVGTLISPDIALSGFHSKAGWLFFCAVALGLIALSRRGRFFTHEPTGGELRDDADEAAWNPTATYLSPLLALLATSLVTGLFVADFDRFYGLRVAAVALAVYLQRAHLPAARWPPSWHAPLIGVAVFALWLWLSPRAAPVYADGLARLSPWAAGLWVTLRVLGAVVAVPLAEELAFRGFLLRRLIDADFATVDKRRLSPAAIAVSSLAFGALHQAYVAGTVAGVAYALAQAARGRTADAVVAHAITNALIALCVLAFGMTWLWA